MNQGGPIQELKTRNAFVPLNPFLTRLFGKRHGLKFPPKTRPSDVDLDHYHVIRASKDEIYIYTVCTSCLIAYYHVLVLVPRNDSALESPSERRYTSSFDKFQPTAFSKFGSSRIVFNPLFPGWTAGSPVTYNLHDTKQHCTLTHYIKKHKFHMAPFLPRGPFWRRLYLGGPSLRVRAEP